MTYFRRLSLCTVPGVRVRLIIHSHALWCNNCNDYSCILWYRCILFSSSFYRMSTVCLLSAVIGVSQWGVQQKQAYNHAVSPIGSPSTIAFGNVDFAEIRRVLPPTKTISKRCIFQLHIIYLLNLQCNVLLTYGSSVIADPLVYLTNN